MSIFDDTIIDKVDEKISELSLIRIKEFLYRSVPCDNCGIALGEIFNCDKTYSWKGNIYTLYDVCKSSSTITLRDPSKPVYVILSRENERDNMYLNWLKKGQIFPIGTKIHVYDKCNRDNNYEEIII